MLRSNARERPPGWNNNYVVSACFGTAVEHGDKGMLSDLPRIWKRPITFSRVNNAESSRRQLKENRQIVKETFHFFFKALDLFWQMTKSVVRRGTTLPRVRPSPTLAHKAKGYAFTAHKNIPPHIIPAGSGGGEMKDWQRPNPVSLRDHDETMCNQVLYLVKKLSQWKFTG